MTKNALTVLRHRYLKKNARGRVIESPHQMFDRVAKNIASAERNFGPDSERFRKEFFHLLSSLRFLPNSPTLMNAGRDLQQLSACFVLPVEDNLESIFEAVKDQAIIQQSGGGTGFSFSRLRPKNDRVMTTSGVASGPVSFIRIFNMSTDVIKQGGARRGANMAILRADHPDIIEFITVKEDPAELTNFNLSVGVTDDFMERARRGRRYPLIHPRSGKEVGRLSAAKVLDLIVREAWKTGEPGMVFLDRINRDHPVPELGRIEATNPCGEQPLLPYESCNLGSINLARMIRRSGQKRTVDFDLLEETVRLAVRFLDDVIEANHYPLPQIDEMTKQTRKIGLGVMGLADALIALEIPYDSDAALNFAEDLMRRINSVARDASLLLGTERGVFPAFEKSVFAQRGVPEGSAFGAEMRPPLRFRNSTRTTIAPTGTLSVIAGCSSGIEPLYGVAYVRNVLGGIRLPEIHPEFVRLARRHGFYSERLMQRVAAAGSIAGFAVIPKEIRRLFVTAHDIAPEFHVKMQAAFQRQTDNAVSKTINFRTKASPQEVRRAFLLAYEEGCKGITIYRSGSREKQVLACTQTEYC